MRTDSGSHKLLVSQPLTRKYRSASTPYWVATHAVRQSLLFAVQEVLESCQTMFQVIYVYSLVHKTAPVNIMQSVLLYDVNQARRAAQEAQADVNIRRALCNCPQCLQGPVPLEERVLRQKFHQTNTARYHWQLCGAADFDNIPLDPCLKFKRARWYCPAEVYDGLNERAWQLQQNEIHEQQSSTDDGLSSDWDDMDIDSSTSSAVEYSDDFRTSSFTRNYIVGHYAQEAPLPPSEHWLQQRQPGADGSKVYKGQNRGRRRAMGKIL